MSDRYHTLDGVEQHHPLYDTALEEIVFVLPPELTDDVCIPLAHVRNMMVLSWLRGAGWASEHPENNP